MLSVNWFGALTEQVENWKQKWD